MKTTETLVNEAVVVTTDTEDRGYWGPMLGVYGREQVWHDDVVTTITAEYDTLMDTDRVLRVQIRRTRVVLLDRAGGEIADVSEDTPARANHHEARVAWWEGNIERLANNRQRADAEWLASQN